jgi:hypothetical protein
VREERPRHPGERESPASQRRSTPLDRGYRESELLNGRRWLTRALALKKADERKAQDLREGGIPIA